jgi:CHAD domain-containing protein
MSSASILALQRRYDIDVAHVQHVCSLATTLFVDALEAHRCDPCQLLLLQAAALTHDLGARDDPTRHSKHSRDIIEREGLRGFSEIENAAIASMVRFHRGRVRQDDEPLWTALPDTLRGQTLWMSALLRVADGLDYNHVQKATISRVVGRRHPVICVRDNYDEAIADSARACSKADLWRELTGSKLRILTKPRGRRPGTPPVSRGMSLECSAGIILRHRVAEMYACILGLGSIRGVEQRHDIRVAIRRFRSTLRLYRRIWADNATDRLHIDLRQVSNLAGEVRDTELVEEWLRKAAASAPKKVRDSLQSAIFDAQRRRRRSLGTLIDELRSDKVSTVLKTADDWASRTSMSEKVFARGRRALKQEAPKILRRHARRILDYDIHPDEQDGERLHALRKRCRRMRYAIESWYGALRSGRADILARLRAVQDSLGDLHDADVHMMLLTDTGNEELMEWLRDRCADDRRVAWEQFESEWPKLRKLLNERRLARIFP